MSVGWTCLNRFTWGKDQALNKRAKSCERKDGPPACLVDHDNVPQEAMCIFVHLCAVCQVYRELEFATHLCESAKEAVEDSWPSVHFVQPQGRPTEHCKEQEPAADAIEKMKKVQLSGGGVASELRTLTFFLRMLTFGLATAASGSFGSSLKQKAERNFWSGHSRVDVGHLFSPMAPLVQAEFWTCVSSFCFLGPPGEWMSWAQMLNAKHSMVKDQVRNTVRLCVWMCSHNVHKVSKSPRCCGTLDVGVTGMGWLCQGNTTLVARGAECAVPSWTQRKGVSWSWKPQLLAPTTGKKQSDESNHSEQLTGMKTGMRWDDTKWHDMIRYVVIWDMWYVYKNVIKQTWCTKLYVRFYHMFTSFKTPFLWTRRMFVHAQLWKPCGAKSSTHEGILGILRLKFLLQSSWMIW